MTKKKVFWISLAGVIVLILLAIVQTKSGCYAKAWCSQLWGTINAIGQVLYLIIPLFILSLVTYFLPEKVFRTWLHFAYGWIPVSLFFVYLASGSSGGGFGMPNVFDQETVSIIFSGLFLIISLIIILIKYFSTKK